MRNNKYLYLITLTYFALGFINIHFSLIGLICMIIPFILLFKNKKKTWCQSYCPRSSLYTKVGKIKKHSRPTPKFFTKGSMKYIILTYFSISLFIIFMSTLMVANGKRPPMDYLRFLIFIRLPGTMPQLISFHQIVPWITHLSYRMYSMMMTTTLLGLSLGLFYKPRTWCTVCPIATLSDGYLTHHRKKMEHK